MEAWSTWNFAVMDEIVVSDFSVRTVDRAAVNSLEALKQLATVSRSTFPDGRFTVESIITEGNLVAIPWS
jgi:predicted ester cyclase